MPLNSTLFAVQVADPGDLPAVERRVDALARYYRPLGQPVATIHRVSKLRLLAGQIDFGGAGQKRFPLVWGGPIPPELRNARDLIEADDHTLRRIEGVTAIVAVDGDRAAVLTGTGGITSLYRAEAGGTVAFCSHAVGAAWLAAGAVEIDRDAIFELVARRFVGGGRTLIANVDAVDIATRVRLNPAGAEVDSFWSRRERWAFLPEHEAFPEAERELLASLARRTAASRALFLGLTGGLDSRVAAVALAQLGISFGAYTWGDWTWDDVSEAKRVATVLGLDHRQQPIGWRDDDEALRLIDAEARWTEGAIAVRIGGETYPAEMAGLINGFGGEIARAVSYPPAWARAHPAPSFRVLARVVDGRSYLATVPRDRRKELRASERRWLEDAYALGVRGWRCLDVVYSEQRVRRWRRAVLPRTGAEFVPAFVTAALERSLLSLSLEERLTGGFHRRFLSRVPALVPSQPTPAGPRLRSRLAGLPGARWVVSSIREPRRLAAARSSWFAAEKWPDRPRTRSWIAEDALASPLLIDGLGHDWVTEIRTGFLNDEALSTEHALLAAAPVALEQSLRDLR